MWTACWKQAGRIMNRIDAKFAELRKSGRKGLIGYMTAGDPDYKRSVKNILSAIRSGLDVLELGVPFSDPTADGPTIQAASQRSLAAGTTLAKALKMVSDIRRKSDIPIVLFGYANPFFRFGYGKFAREASRAGVDGVLVVDLPFDESAEMTAALEDAGIYFIRLVAPTTEKKRARLILRNAKGFVYYIMVTGVTGKRTAVAADLAEHVARLKKLTATPIAVGFGVSNGKQARQAAKSADAVVVGSALVEAAQAGRLSKLTSELRSALDR